MGTVIRSTSAFGRVPIVQMTVAAGIELPSRRATARSPTNVARVLDSHVDAACRERAVRRNAKTLGQLRKQSRLIVQQRHLQLVGRDPRVIAPEAREAVDELACGLDTGEAAADDDEPPEAATDRRVGLEFDLRNAPEHRVADVHRVADRLQRQRVLGEPRE